ncbi:MAG TPA: Lrp/AsnC family transcriptional regulator [Thermodesulfobacteriota bacterium]|nr:Lrp/AsnC family transcriptional regulator [Thermodesulfobacteriota bacterium]
MRPVELTAKDRKLLAQIQGDLPLCTSPYAVIAQKTGWDEKELVRRIKSFIRRGMIRRFGAILRHQKAGYQGNAMVVWKVAEDDIPRVSRAMVSFPAVSHCYLRAVHPQWPFNLYTMVHGQSERDCRRIAWQISKNTGMKDYRILFSKREHKKSSMTYF